MFVHMICCITYAYEYVYTHYYVYYNEKMVEYTETTNKDANEIEISCATLIIW